MEENLEGHVDMEDLAVWDAHVALTKLRHNFVQKTKTELTPLRYETSPTKK